MENERTSPGINSGEEITQYPSLVKRVQSIFIDGMLLIILMFVIAGIFGDSEEIPGALRGLILYGMWLLYEPVCIAYGYTLGNYIMKIRVRKVTDMTKKISLPQSFLRLIVKSALGWLSFVSIHFNENKRAIHDLASGSVMIEVA